MAEIQFPEFPTPSQDEWKYYLSFGTPQDYLHEIARALQEDNRFFTDFRFLKLLYWYAKRPKEHEVAKHILLAGQVLYRARIYDVQHDKCEKNSAFQGYGEKDSFIPPDHNSVPEGRINPARIKYLYTAYSIPTAIAEVRPFIKAEVSVAEITVLENLEILSFCAQHSSTTLDGKNDDVLKWKSHLKLAFTELFNRSYTSPRDYLLCQYISEFIKNLGYDGVAFRSSKVCTDLNRGSNNINYTIFHYEKCKATSSRLFFIKDQSYDIKRKNDSGYYEPFEG